MAEVDVLRVMTEAVELERRYPLHGRLDVEILLRLASPPPLTLLLESITCFMGVAQS